MAAADEAVVALVVGAGPAGIACAGELRRRGVRTVVLEQASSVADRWRRRYDRLRLNTSRWFSHLPGARYPRGTGLFPTKEETAQHVEHQVRARNIEVRTGVRVERLERENDRWIVQTSDGVWNVPHVIIATGLSGKPVVPGWPGRERFRGTLLHSDEYRNPEPFRGQTVLVVGAGSSGMEIAHDLKEAGVSAVWMAVRTPPNILLRSIGGLPGDPAALVLLRLPPRVADAFMAVLRRLTIGDLSDYGLPAPEEGPFERMHRDGAAPAVVDPEILDAIRASEIEIVAGVQSFDEQGVQLEDGRRLEPDTVIAATGYRSGLEPLVGHLGVLDGRGMPRSPAGEEAAPGLRFIGFRPVPALIHDVGKQAKHVAREIATVSMHRHHA